MIFKTAAFNRWSLTAKGPALAVTQTFGVAPLWHGRLRIEGFWPGLAGTSRSQKAIRPNTYAYSRSLIGIIAIRFDSRWRYQKSPRIQISNMHTTLPGATPLEAAIVLNREPTRFHAFHKNLNDIRYDWCRWRFRRLMAPVHGGASECRSDQHRRAMPEGRCQEGG